VAWEVVTAAFELHGGYGFMKDMGMGMEKLLRDVSTFLHSDGANRSLLLKAARFIRRAEPALVWKSYLQAAA
jgi:alkylation response protein AidB-like acyl-CoA dehydrogenase